MITIWKKVSEENFELVEEFTGDVLELASKLNELRANGNEYRAEQRNDCFSLIFDL
jgi:hypothetical protein